MFHSFLVTLLVIACVDAKLKTYDGYQVLNIIPEHEEHLKILHRLRRDYSHILDFWSDPHKAEKPVTLSVPPQYNEFVKNILDQSNLPSEIIIDNLKEVLGEDWKEILAKNDSNSASLAEFDLSRFHRYSEINDFLQSLSVAYPSITSLFRVGKSSENRAIKGIKISSKNSAIKRGIFIDAGFHAREWAAPATALYIINKLVTEYNSNPEIRRLVDELNWYIVPLANPDGYEFTWTDERFWRKTRSKQPCDENEDEGCCYGVDPNRNWAYHFGGEGTSGNPCSDIYRGDEAMSEPEVRGMASKILELSDELKAYVSLHSFSELWLLPYGYDADAEVPEDFKEMVQLATEAEKATEKVHKVPYTVEQSAKLYPAAGASDDWVKGVAKIKYVYTIELRPDESAPGLTGFRLPANQIIPSGEEIFAGMKVIADRIIQEF